MSETTLPREDLFRASYPGLELRGAFGQETPPTLTGHFAIFDSWTEINSMWEGKFLERIAPGAFKRTIANNRAKMRVLFQHGRDPQIGDKPLGQIDVLEEDTIGARYEVPLIDTSYNRDLLPGLEAGLYGASFRFTVKDEQIDDEPGESAMNPHGLPERTIREAQVLEFGPVTFPAYDGATAGIRSLTDLVHDVDAMVRATPILLDDDRLAHARAFITRNLPELPVTPDPEDHRDTEPIEDDQEAPTPTEPATTTSHLAPVAREKGRSHLIPPKREGTSLLL